MCFSDRLSVSAKLSIMYRDNTGSFLSFGDFLDFK